MQKIKVKLLFPDNIIKDGILFKTALQNKRFDSIIINIISANITKTEGYIDLEIGGKSIDIIDRYLDEIYNQGVQLLKFHIQ